MTDRYRDGDHAVICDRTGFRVYASQAKREWNGLLVREQSWEPRHPQDTIRGVPERSRVTDPRPRQANRFLGTNEVTRDDL